MKNTEYKWKAFDGLDLYGQSWEPSGRAAKAVICLVHGVGEHSSRYAHVAEAFGKEGYATVSMDLRGHGRSGGIRGHIDSADDFPKDIDLLIEKAGELFPGLPKILYGHSLGGILVLYYGLKRNPDVKGVVATSPGLHNAVEEQPVKIAAARVLGSLLPRTTMPSGLDTKAISRDEKVVADYLKDPLVHDKLSLGFGKIMLGVTAWTLANAGQFPRPLLLLHGKADTIAYPTSSTDVADALKDKCTIVLWDDAYHELHNEPEKAEVFKTITIWMDARIRE